MRMPNGDGRGPVLLAAGIEGASKSVEIKLRWNLGSQWLTLGADLTLRTHKVGITNSWSGKTAEVGRPRTCAEKVLLGHEMLNFLKENSNG